MTTRRYAIVGGGIVGIAVAHRLLERDGDAVVTVFEKENEIAAHQTGHNSGVVHAGLYYTPGSLKARLCREGVELLKSFCSEHKLAYEEVGKVLVALNEEEVSRLTDIEERARANGVPGVRRIGAEELNEMEPHVSGIGALHSPTTAIIDYRAVTQRLSELVIKVGGQIKTGTEVAKLRESATGVIATLKDGAEEDFDFVVLCTGLQADRIARQIGADADPRIMPFRGEYYKIRPERRCLVNGLVYPVPDPRYPFLGVHMTPRVDGEVLIGPNAVLALGREGYSWTEISPRDLIETLRWPGFWSFARKNWRTGITEMAGSLSKARFVAAARRYVPELSTADVVPGPRGVRAQAMKRDGSLVDDFHIDLRGRVLALRNAPSPAATSSLAIARELVEEISRAFPRKGAF